ncbi:sulfotransferase family 2 domain-containing protein [Desulfothermus okinawensis]
MIDSIVFLHIPKTGGTTLTDFIIKSLGLKSEEIFNCGQQARTHIEGNIKFIKLNSKEKKKFKFVCGHVEISLIKQINYPILSLTILREPVDRIVSMYYYIRSNKNHHLHSLLVNNKMSISDFVKSGCWIEINNGMVRRLSGGLNIPYGKCNLKMLEIAKYNLLTAINLFGFLEYFDEFVSLLGKLLDISQIKYSRKNVTRGRKKIEEIDESDINIIKYYNPLDISLYNWAKEVYNSKIKIFSELY